jgi:hypothetical protein
MKTMSLASVLAASALVAGCSSDTYRGEVSYRTSLVQYASCSDLETDLKDMLIAEVETRFSQLASDFGRGDQANPGAEDGDSSGGREEGVDFSGTNNQEDGVDEADFVKTDGYYVYVLNGNRLHIFAVPEFGELLPESTIEVEGTPRQMLINREAAKAVIFSTIWPGSLPEGHPLREVLGTEVDSGWMWRAGSVTKVTVLDVSDRGAPTLERELFLEANYQTARMVDGSVRVGAYSWIQAAGLWDWWWYYWDSDYDVRRAKRRAIARIRASSLAELIPQIYERDPEGTLVSHSLSEDSCRSFYRPMNSNGYGMTSILSLDLFGDALDYDANHVVTNWPTLYSSRDYMYIAEPANSWWWFWWNEDHPELLNIHKFDIRTPGESTYLGSGRVEGVLNNQFSLSEHEGYLRVATTTNMWGRWWLDDAEESENHLYVLGLEGDELVTVGYVGGLAPGERIFSTRMIGDKGYMVTFEMIDPLFTFDLSDPTDPRVIGELKIPGFSTYIHPIADERLLTIGFGGDENGTNWRTQVSMFDVSDFAAPATVDNYELAMPGDWGWSEALYEHKAFQYWAPKGLLALPMSSYSWRHEDGYQYTSRLELLSVDTATGFTQHGAIDHSHLYNTDPDWYWYFRDIRRSIFMGDFVYAISDRGITVHDVEDLTQVAEEPLPGYSPHDYWWWW